MKIIFRLRFRTKRRDLAVRIPARPAPAVAETCPVRFRRVVGVLPTAPVTVVSTGISAGLLTLDHAQMLWLVERQNEKPVAKLLKNVSCILSTLRVEDYAGYRWFPFAMLRDGAWQILWEWCDGSFRRAERPTPAATPRILEAGRHIGLLQ